MDPKVHKEVLEYFEDAHNVKQKGHSEGAVAGYIQGERKMLFLPAHLRRSVTDSIRRAIAKWVKIPYEQLEPTSTYGIRVYYNQSILETHVDRVETHILSAVYCIDRRYSERGAAEPWFMVADPDFSGSMPKVDLLPGELFLYESAKVAHGRPSTLHGDYYASIFTHFRPVDWPYTNMDRVYGVPPNWEQASVRQEL